MHEQRPHLEEIFINS